MFWTTHVPESAVHVAFPEAIATIEVSGLGVVDSLTIFNALSCGSSVPATVSFDVDWGSALDRYEASDPSQDFTAKGWLTDAFMSWTAESGGATYRSVGPGTSVFEEWALLRLIEVRGPPREPVIAPRST